MKPWACSVFPLSPFIEVGSDATGFRISFYDIIVQDGTEAMEQDDCKGEEEGSWLKLISLSRSHQSLKEVTEGIEIKEVHFDS